MGWLPLTDNEMDSPAPDRNNTLMGTSHKTGIIARFQDQECYQKSTGRPSTPTGAKHPSEKNLQDSSL